MSRNKYVSLSLIEKLDIINDSKKNLSKQQLLQKYKCSVTTINRVLRNQSEILKKSQALSLGRKRERESQYTEIDKLLLDWYQQQISSGETVSSNALIQKAKAFAVMLNQDFNPTSKSWLWRWKKRHAVTFIKNEANDEVNGEANDEVNDAVTASTTVGVISEQSTSDTKVVENTVQEPSTSALPSPPVQSSSSAAASSSTPIKDSLDLFFESVSASVRTFSPRLIAELKGKISAILTEFEIRAIIEQESITSDIKNLSEFS